MYTAIFVGFGAAIAILLILVVRTTPVQHQRKMSGMTLMIAAAIYWILALLNGPFSWLIIESAGAIVFTGLAWFGIQKRALFIPLGWILHVGWDVLLHDHLSTPFVPKWYPALCVGFDVVVAFYLFSLFSSQRKQRH